MLVCGEMGTPHLSTFFEIDNYLRAHDAVCDFTFLEDRPKERIKSQSASCAFLVVFLSYSIEIVGEIWYFEREDFGLTRTFTIFF